MALALKRTHEGSYSVNQKKKKKNNLSKNAHLIMTSISFFKYLPYYKTNYRIYCAKDVILPTPK